MQFSPEFYKTGMGRLLGSIACELEYPTMWALREIAREAEADKAQRNSGYVPPGAMVKHGSEHWPHASRLETHGLVVSFREGSADRVVISHLGHAFVHFALDECRERGDSE